MMRPINETEDRPTVCNFTYVQNDGSCSIGSDAEEEIYNVFFA